MIDHLAHDFSFSPVRSTRFVVGSLPFILLSASMTWALSACHAYDADPKLAQLVADSRDRAPSALPLGFSAKPAGTPAKEWAIACGGLLSAMNGQYQNSLETAESTPEEIAAQKKSLERWWGVTDRESLLRILQWVQDDGHRKGWDRLADAIESGAPALKSELAQQNPKSQNQINVCTKYYKQVGAKSLLGWDYSRYIELCRWGYMCGYLSKDEAWEKIMPAAKLLQKTFDSWEDLGQNYIIGRKYWSTQETAKSGDIYARNLKTLLSDARSPWVLLKWQTKL